MVSFYRPTSTRNTIVIEKGAFPSDRYAVESQILFHCDAETRRRRDAVKERLIELAPRDGEATLRTEDILQTLRNHADEIALVLLGGVNYYTGQAFEMKAITKVGHEIGAVVGFDLAHAAGNLILQLHDWSVDFAAWCSYKYLNAGPGAVGGIFVHENHGNDFELPRFAGWWGNEKSSRFLMRPEFVPMSGAEGWQISNPPILQMAALRASLEIFHEAGMKRLREKSLRLTSYLEFLLDQIQDGRISVITPRNENERGCQLSIRVKMEHRQLDGNRQQDAGAPLFERISSRGVVADWREPDVIRVAPVPLYNSYTEVFRFAEILKDCLRSEFRL
jgi:kynureninase